MRVKKWLNILIPLMLIHGLVLHYFVVTISEKIVAVDLEGKKPEGTEVNHAYTVWDAAKEKQGPIFRSVFNDVENYKANHIVRKNHKGSFGNANNHTFQVIDYINPILVRNMLSVLGSGLKDGKNTEQDLEDLLNKFIRDKFIKYSERIINKEKITLSKSEIKGLTSSDARDSVNKANGNDSNFLSIDAQPDKNIIEDKKLLEKTIIVFFQNLASNTSDSWHQTTSRFKEDGPWENNLDRFKGLCSNIVSIKNIKVEVETYSEIFAEGRVYYDLEYRELNSPELSYLKNSLLEDSKQVYSLIETFRKKLKKAKALNVDKISNADVYSKHSKEIIIGTCQLDEEKIKEIFSCKNIPCVSSHRWSCKFENKKWLINYLSKLNNLNHSLFS